MNIYLHQHETQTGPFTEEQIFQRVRSREIFAGTLAWHEGLAEWKEIQVLFPGWFAAASIDPEILARREIRIFISSTFRDFMRERDLLVKKVFPALRRKCAARFVTLTEVDLRWGITEAQANEGQVLPLCLAEIERSRPYFIGLLGERYGWIPDEISADLVQREPWLAEHLHGRKSVTELEILHGVLNNPAMRGLAFFYFRDPAYINDSKLTDDERRDMVERDIKADLEKLGAAEAAHRTEERKASLVALKQKIRESRLPLVEKYDNPDALAALIEKQFEQLIDDLYPETAVPDPLARERMTHEAHAKNKLFACVDRPVHLAALNDFAAATGHDGKGLVVTGESGGGKSALLAAWSRDWANAQPDAFLFQHYFGATPESASPEGFLRRLLGELKQRFDLTDEMPTDSDKLREALPHWLAQTVGKGRIVLVLDGLNQVQGSDPDRHLRFLPHFFPEHVTVIASALPGPALDTLRERQWTEHALPLATEAEVDAMVGAYMGIHARTLEPALRQALITANGSKNTLFLRTVLEELRQFGSFEQLPARVKHYLEASEPKELFLRVIRRWQEDFDGIDPNAGGHDLIRRALTHLWAAREGLSEPEWLDLLGDGTKPLPRALWTPLFLALEPHLSQRAGLFAYGHDFLRQAAETEFTASAEAKKSAHLVVADYFERHENQREMTPRKAAEWPYQLHAAEGWDRLEACLTDIPLFLALFNEKSQWELTGYWRPLRDRSRDMGACYTEAYRCWNEAPAHIADLWVPAQLGAFLSVNGLFSAAEPLLRHALEAQERVLGAEHPSTLISVNNLASLVRHQGNYAEAVPLYQRGLEAQERVLGPEHPSTLISVNNFAGLLRDMGDYAGAVPLYQRALEASERVLGPEHPDTLMIVNNLAGPLSRQGNYAEALHLYQRALEARERVLGPEHPDTLSSVHDLAGLLSDQDDYAGALPLYQRALEASERVLGPEHPDTLIIANSLAELLDHMGDYAGAQPLYERALEASERVLGPEHPNTLSSVHGLAGLLKRRGDYAGALPLYQRALKSSERVLGPEHSDTLSSVNNMAGLLSRQGNYAEALHHYQRALEGLLKISQAMRQAHPNLQACASNYVRCLEKLGRSPEQIHRALNEIGRRYGIELAG